MTSSSFEEVTKHTPENSLLGRGIARIPEVMRELRRLDFRGLVAIEYEKEGPVEEDLRKEVEFARALAQAPESGKQ